MKTYIALYRTVAPGNIETDRTFKASASSEDIFRQKLAVMVAALFPGCSYSIQGVSEI